MKIGLNEKLLKYRNQSYVMTLRPVESQSGARGTILVGAHWPSHAATQLLSTQISLSFYTASLLLLIQ